MKLQALHEEVAVLHQEDVIGEDGRFRRLPLFAASSLMAEGYGFGAEGDACSAALVSAGHVLGGDAHFTEMYALDFEKDAVLMSHMGEESWKVARDDERVRLIHRELGIGRLGPPPTFYCSASNLDRRRSSRSSPFREGASVS